MDEAHRYLVALGGNRRTRHGSPRATLTAAIDALAVSGLRVEAVSPVIDSAPLGPSRRRFANAAAVVATALRPPALLASLQAIERAFGRRRGRRWGERALDCDIVLWSGGRWRSRALTIPHPAWRQRAFVLAPVSAIAADWRDPVTGLRPRHLLRRLTRPLPLP